MDLNEKYAINLVQVLSSPKPLDHFYAPQKVASHFYACSIKFFAFLTSSFANFFSYLRFCSQ